MDLFDVRWGLTDLYGGSNNAVNTGRFEIKFLTVIRSFDPRKGQQVFDNGIQAVNVF